MMAAFLFNTEGRVGAPSVGTHEYDGIIDARKMLPRPGILQLVQTALSEYHVSWGIQGKWWADGQFEGRIPMKINPNKYKGVNKEGMKRQFERTQENC